MHGGYEGEIQPSLNTILAKPVTTSFAFSSRHDEQATAPISSLDAGGLDDRPPLVHLGLVELRQIFRRQLLARRELITLLGKLLADRGVAERADHGGVQP